MNGGCRLWFDHRGRGEQALVFLHDFMMSSCVWTPQVGALHNYYDIYTFDFRGFGRSGKPRSECGVQLLTDDLRFMLRELDIRRPILVGAGMGATVAMSYAASSPRAVSELVLIAATSCISRRPDFSWGLSQADLASLVEGLRADFARAANDYFRLVFPHVHDGRAEAFMRVAAHEVDPVTAWSCLRDLAAVDLRPILSSIGAPVSIISSFRDLVSPVWACARLANDVDAKKFIVVPCSDHAPYITVAKHVNDALMSILFPQRKRDVGHRNRQLVAHLPVTSTGLSSTYRDTSFGD